jgi:excisionase family DNA binding protein
MENLILSQIPVNDLINAISNEVLEKLTPLLTAATPVNTSHKEPEKLLTRKDVSKLLKFSLPTIDKYTANGKLPAQRIERQIRYKESEVMAAMTKIKTI